MPFLVTATKFDRLGRSVGDLLATVAKLAPLQEAAGRLGWTVVAVFRDEGISGTTGRDKRPGLDALLKGVSRRDFDIVAAWSVCRLGRSLSDLIGLLGELQSRELFLPPYSPDLNPIEQVFAKLKALLRAKALRTVDALWTALGSLVGCFTADECANYLRHAGYLQSN